MYLHAVSDARCVFDIGVSDEFFLVQHFLIVLVVYFDSTHHLFSLFQEEIGFSMNILDIGGGFNGCETQLELVSTFISVQSSKKQITLDLITFSEALILQTFQTVVVIFRLIE